MAAFVLSFFLFGATTVLTKMPDRRLLQITGAVAAVLIWLDQVDNVFASSLKGAERFAEAARIEMVARFCQISFCALIVVNLPRLTLVYSALIVVAIARTLAKALFVRHEFSLPKITFGARDLDRILRYARWGWVQGLGGLLFGMADRFVIASLLGPTVLAQYSVAVQLAQQAHAIPAAGMSVLFPKVSRRIATGRGIPVLRLTFFATGAALLVGGLIAIPLVLFPFEVLALWVGKDIARSSSELLRSLSIAYCMLVTNVAPHFMLLGLGNVRAIALSSIVAGVVSVATAVLLIERSGVIGAAWARTVYAVVVLVFLVPSLYGLTRTKSR
jgi:O-antigen/teichoic acid export membrane protein